MNPRQRRTAHLDAWRRSVEFREIARAQAQKLNRERASRPRCGATKRTDGEPCRHPAMANGRCRLHGGRTPKDAGWHQPTFAKDMSKWAAKGRDRERAAKKRARRLARLSPEDRAAHQAWQKTHKPGPRGPRAAARERRRQDHDASRALSSAAPMSSDPDPEREELAKFAAVLRAQIADIEAGKRPLNAFD